MTQGSEETFINVSDRPTEVIRYRYTGTVPTYQRIYETEALSLVSKWLDKLFPWSIELITKNVFVHRRTGHKRLCPKAIINIFIHLD